MIVVLLVLALWFTAALALAVLLGRTAARADREEIGSELVWDISEIDREVFRSR